MLLTFLRNLLLLDKLFFSPFLEELLAVKVAVVRKPDIWQHSPYVIADFRRGLNEICDLLRCYAA